MHNPQQVGEVPPRPYIRVLPWLLVALLGLALIALMPAAYWRSSGVGPQVQVPMFYDAHYLFPRPWTQDQAAPGVPAPAPLGFYGKNRVQQTFVAGSDQLAMVSVWLAGAQDTPVSLTLEDEESRQWQSNLSLSAGPTAASYALAFPAVADSAGKKFTMTLAAPQATAEQPVMAMTVGGDRFGHTLHLNEFVRPGNLVMMTYSRNWPGVWWLDALGEQILPSVFRLRLQQYKPPAFKGALFSWLLLLSASLSALLLVLASPKRLGGDGLVRGLGWTLAVLLGGLLLWQFMDGRAVISAENVGLAPAAGTHLAEDAARDPAGSRLISDLASDLWTAVREPEARFVDTEITDELPAIRVPGSSRIDYALVVPPQSRVRFAHMAQGAGSVQFEVWIGDELLDQMPIMAEKEPAFGNLMWKELDLERWTGEGITLSLRTLSEHDDVQGIWIMPQVLTDAPWLLSDPPTDFTYLPVGVVYDDILELLGVVVKREMGGADDALLVQLLWRPLKTIDRSGKVFVHLLGAGEQLAAQHDGFPVYGAYPTTIWQPGIIVLDEHRLPFPGESAVEPYRLAIGVYDPDSLARWSTTGAGGKLLEDGRAIVPLPAGALP